MKIVAISGSQVPSSAANSLQALKATHALAQLGHEVTLVVPVSDSPLADWDELAKHYGLQTEFRIEYLPSASRRLFFLSAVRCAKKMNPDLLYAWPLQSAVLGLMNGMAVVLEMHDLPSGRVGPLWFRYFRDFKGTKRMTVITKALQNALTERYGAFLSPSDVVLAPNGAEPERYQQLPAPQEARRALGLPDALTAVCTGHLYAGRGMELFVELAKRKPEIRFVWAGGKPEDVQVWQTKTKDIANITFTGFVPNAQLSMYQAAADFLLMPYAREIGISGGVGNSAQVSSPMKMFEYMASGRAILASDLPVFHEILDENNAVFCSPEKPKAWEGALQAMADNPARRMELGNQARADAQKYSWTERAKRILDGFPGRMKRSVFLIMLVAFLLRLGLGLTGAVLLPQIGYESKPQQAGYLFFDAYRRDSQAWELAQSEKSLSRAFDQKFASDQYGGLLWMSAFVYRYLSAGTHQPLLIVFLAALSGTLGIWFIYRAGKRLLDEKSALLAALLFAFFPEAILQGASQMREPFLMSLIAMSYYGLVEWQERRANTGAGKSVWLWIVVGLAGMYVISPGFVLVTLIAGMGWLYFSDEKREIPWQALAGAAAVFLLALLALIASWDSLVSARGGGVFGILGGWARETTRWNAYLLGRSSGIVQLLFQAMPPSLALPFVAVYGILQPVLPAAILEPSVPFWQTIGIIRSLGWYLLLPLVAFAPFTAMSLPAGSRKRQWLWLCLVVWGWIVVAALRGGGDQWDNPRYRVILLVWMALLAAMAFSRRNTNIGRWLWRIIAVEGIILLVFGHWYVWRYLGFGLNLGIRNTLGLALGLSIALVLGDWLWMRHKAASQNTK